MGYELELRIREPRARHDLDHRCIVLERRWQRANARVEDALAAVVALRGFAPHGAPARVAAELRLAEARRRRQELADEIERLDFEPAFEEL